MLTEANIVEYQERHGLSYHVPHALQAQASIGLRGKAVLEIGGSLPRDFVLEGLGARQWIAIEEMAYWHESDPGGDQKMRPAENPGRSLAAAGAHDLAADYRVLSGRAEQLPAMLHGRFDAAFSLAAFEHVDQLATVLGAIHAALRPGGMLFTMFSPIWSAHDGHHLPAVRDPGGEEFSHLCSPIPPWGHLLMRPPELLEHLCARTDRATAAKIVYYVYDSPHINRLFTEDYVACVEASDFEIERCDATFLTEVPPATQSELERRHAPHRQFDNNGMLLVLRRRG